MHSALVGGIRLWRGRVAALWLFAVIGSLGLGGSVHAMGAEAGSISGTLMAAGDSPAAQVNVEAHRFDPTTSIWIKVAVVQSDASGQYYLEGLAPDTYRVGFQEKCPGVRGQFYGGATFDSASPVIVAPGEAVSGKNVQFKGCTFTNLTPPTISGTPVVGGTLLAHPGTWEPSLNGNFSVDWLADGVVVRAGSNGAFDLLREHVGKRISARVVAFYTAPGWQPGYATSAVTEPVVDYQVDPQPAVNTARPKIRGTAKVGVTLKATPGKWSPASGMTFKYQWLANGKAIKKATKKSFKVTKVMKGKKIQVRVSALVPGARASVVRSKPTARISA